PKQTTESVLHDIVRVAGLTSDPVDVRPEWACRSLIEPRKLDLGQCSTLGRASDFAGGRHVRVPVDEAHAPRQLQRDVTGCEKTCTDRCRHCANESDAFKGVHPDMDEAEIQEDSNAEAQHDDARLKCPQNALVRGTARFGGDRSEELLAALRVEELAELPNAAHALEQP